MAKRGLAISLYSYHPFGYGITELEAILFNAAQGFDNASNSRAREKYLLITGVAVEKLGFSEKRRKLVDRKCLGEPKKSFVQLPDAI